MPANRLLFADDFSGYTSDADVAAAYPGPAGAGYSVNSADWGPTFGPDGQPGIKDQASAPATDTGDLEKHFLATECYWFKVKGRWDHAATNAILTKHSFLRLQWWSADGSEVDAIITVNADHTNGALEVLIETTAPYGNISSNNRYFVSVPNGLPRNTPNTVEVNGRRSTMTETSPGVWDAEPDGEVHVLVGGVELVTFSGPVWTRRTDQNPAPYWNAVLIKTIGAFSDLEIWDETGCGTAPVIDVSTPCCVTDTGPGGSTGPILEPEPTQGTPIPEWESAGCGFGGLVPTAADVVHSEDWAFQ